MNKVVTISLNSHAYQLEEAGYDALRSYLTTAQMKLANNPDHEEIVRDLEQAIADKLTRLMPAHATVATKENVTQVLDEMGPVDASEGSEAASTNDAPHPKRLFRIRQGAILGGVCTGLAAYFNMDVTTVRVLWVALTVLTGGGWILVYIVMMILVPYADTPEQVARAEGKPWNAQEILDQARESLEEIRKNGREWKKKIEQEHEKWSAREGCKYRYHHHNCDQGGHSVLGQIIQLTILVAIVWAVYEYIPSTRPVYETVGVDIQQGWVWLNAKVQK